MVTTALSELHWEQQLTNVTNVAVCWTVWHHTRVTPFVCQLLVAGTTSVHRLDIRAYRLLQSHTFYIHVFTSLPKITCVASFIISATAWRRWCIDQCFSVCYLNKNVGPPYWWAEMYAGRIASCPLVSYGEYADRTDRRTDGRMPDRYIMLFARRGPRINSKRQKCCSSSSLSSSTCATS